MLDASKRCHLDGKKEEKKESTVWFEENRLISPIHLYNRRFGRFVINPTSGQFKLSNLTGTVIGRVGSASLIQSNF